MRITLLHNPSAGSGSPTAAELEGWLSEKGHEVFYVSSDDEQHALISRPADLVMAAGGDGTAATAMRTLAGRDIPVTILPLGTANNIANTLGIHGSPPELIGKLLSGRPRVFDVPGVSGRWGTHRFLESVGLGLFAAVLRDAQREERAEGIDTGMQDLNNGRGDRMRDALRRLKPVWRQIEADGVDLSGDCFFVAAFNTPSIGPRLALAPDADPGDGFLDLLVITEQERDALARYLAAVDDDPAARLSVPTRKCRNVILDWDPHDGHLDDQPWPEPSAPAAGAHRHAIVRVEAGSATVTILVPAD